MLGEEFSSLQPESPKKAEQRKIINEISMYRSIWGIL
jgi:hypothetical protein